MKECVPSPSQSSPVIFLILPQKKQQVKRVSFGGPRPLIWVPFFRLVLDRGGSHHALPARLPEVRKELRPGLPDRPRLEDRNATEKDDT